MTNITGGCYDGNSGWVDCNQDKVPTVSVSPIGGNYTSPITVTLTANDDRDANPIIYYTLDDTTPTTDSPLRFVKTGTSAQGMPNQIIHRHPDRTAPIGIPAKQIGGGLTGVVF